MNPTGPLEGPGPGGGLGGEAGVPDPVPDPDVGLLREELELPAHPNQVKLNNRSKPKAQARDLR